MPVQLDEYSLYGKKLVAAKDGVGYFSGAGKKIVVRVKKGQVAGTIVGFVWDPTRTRQYIAATVTGIPGKVFYPMDLLDESDLRNQGVKTVYEKAKADDLFKQEQSKTFGDKAIALIKWGLVAGAGAYILRGAAQGYVSKHK